jgi:hypothetical protein
LRKMKTTVGVKPGATWWARDARRHWRQNWWRREPGFGPYNPDGRERGGGGIGKPTCCTLVTSTLLSLSFLLDSILITHFNWSHWHLLKKEWITWKFDGIKFWFNWIFYWFFK